MHDQKASTISKVCTLFVRFYRDRKGVNLAEDESENSNNKKTGIPDLVSYIKPVDVNRVRLRILIICANERNFESAITYLMRRGWQTQITVNVMEAFKQITTFDPNFILVSANIKSSKINTLPSIIFQTFKVPVILFGENAETLTLKLLQEINSNFKMPGIASGPSIHRSIKNILHELSKSHDPMAKQIYEKVAKTVKSNGGQTSEEARWKKQKKGYTFSIDEEKKEDKKETITKFYEKMDAEERERARQAGEDQARAEENNLPSIVMDPSDDLASLAAKYYREAQNNNSIEASAIELENIEITQDASEDEQDVIFDDIDEDSKSDKLDRFEEIIDNKHKLKNKGLELSSFDKSSVDIDLDKFKHYVATIAEGTCEQTVSIQVGGEPQITCALWPLNTPKTFGIVIIKVHGTWAQTKFFTTKFENNIREYLLLHLPGAEIGDKLDFEQSVELKNKVEGEVFTTQAGGEQFSIEVKYMLIKSRDPILEKTIHGDKLKIDVNELVTGLPTGADVYIYLPINNKFIRYINEKTRISDKQINILKGTEAFINEDEATSYKKNFTRNKAIQQLLHDAPKKKKTG